MKRDPQKRLTYMKREVYVWKETSFFWNPLSIILSVLNRDPQKRPVCMKNAHKRNLYIWKEACKRDLQMKRPVYMQRESYSRIYATIFATRVILGLFPRKETWNSLLIKLSSMNRDLQKIWTSIKRNMQKRGIYMKRTIHLLEFVVHRNVADMKWDPQNRPIYLKRDMYEENHSFVGIRCPS